MAFCKDWLATTGCVHSHWFQRGNVCSTPRRQRDAYSVVAQQALRSESSDADARDPSFLVPVGSLQGAARHETMVYLTADGSVVEKRSLFRLSLPLDILWGVIDFVSIFFQTLIDPEGAKAEMRRRPRGGGATGRGGGGGPSGGCGAKKIRGMKGTQGAMSACGAGG